MMEGIRLPGFIWTALIAAATAGLLALGDGLANVNDWWAPLAVALVGAALKGIQEAQAKSEVIELVDAEDDASGIPATADVGVRSAVVAGLTREVSVLKVELELPPFWQRFLLG